ncbi:hypothetical protein BTW10_11600 [Chromohalobacter japonicus]|uniref:Uncharacterized protein n=1 Tax=Chromohalobacter japonicus TaxID=223900 RepID=A0A1Q8TBR5_9GAMM|nr:hypothetical protein [Chromohalobacter japonicus]OLO11105.1 hypothetical protein BTW10_11600 [Chromohalobacter japonicus]
MTHVQIAGLVSAILGTIGTVILFLASYALQSFVGGVLGSEEVNKHNEDIRVNNANRIRFQRVGLAFLCGSFCVQAVAVFL